MINWLWLASQSTESDVVKVVESRLIKEKNERDKKAARDFDLFSSIYRFPFVKIYAFSLNTVLFADIHLTLLLISKYYVFKAIDLPHENSVMEVEKIAVFLIRIEQSI